MQSARLLSLVFLASMVKSVRQSMEAVSGIGRYRGKIGDDLLELMQEVLLVLL